VLQENWWNWGVIQGARGLEPPSSREWNQKVVTAEKMSCYHSKRSLQVHHAETLHHLHQEKTFIHSNFKLLLNLQVSERSLLLHVTIIYTTLCEEAFKEDQHISCKEKKYHRVRQMSNMYHTHPTYKRYKVRSARIHSQTFKFKAIAFEDITQMMQFGNMSKSKLNKLSESIRVAEVAPTWHAHHPHQPQFATSFNHIQCIYNKQEAKEDARVEDALKIPFHPYLLGKCAFIASLMY